MEIRKKVDKKLKDKKPDIRYLYDMKGVIFDKEWVKEVPNLELYYMYRGINKRGDLRYDITIIPPRMLGKEFIKTKGHEHVIPQKELYIVLEGKAIYLMQKYDKNRREITDVFVVEAKSGESIIIPREYGHVAINPLDKELKMANWINNKYRNDYSLFEKMRGACYYYTERGWIKNKNYIKIPRLRFEKPLESIPDNLDFLK